MGHNKIRVLDLACSSSHPLATPLFLPDERILAHPGLIVQT